MQTIPVKTGLPDFNKFGHNVFSKTLKNKKGQVLLFLNISVKQLSNVAIYRILIIIGSC